MYIYNFDDVAEWWRKPILKYELKDINFKQKKRKNTEIKEFYVEKLIIMWKSWTIYLIRREQSE